MDIHVQPGYDTVALRLQREYSTPLFLSVNKKKLRTEAHSDSRDWQAASFMATASRSAGRAASECGQPEYRA